MRIREIILISAMLTMLFHISNPLNAQNMKKEKTPQKLSAFPVGDENPEINARYFTGQSYLASLAGNKALNCPIYNVTFEPDCRNNWHRHTGGQILIVVGGKGCYQEKGKPAQLLLPGDIVEIAPDVIHWHGAVPDSWFSHLAIECNPQINRNIWLEVVDDKQYKEAIAGAQGTNEIHPKIEE